ncbi:TlpA disulfide reductase family protein [uncultured Winogradskyella sp.]|uniref:TlpA family protein disulfide reductase n=1 Tax=uncultured Winogradskyella sp. TaxID=395353 RepID=UPI0026071F26|nr:TlpA disulfide reductase family protein [uncultured Winogradskyella sp.]
MKKLIIVITLIFCFTTLVLEAQGLKIDQNTSIKNVEGKTIDLDTFTELMTSGEWMISPKQDKDGKAYIQLRKASKEEKEMIMKMTKEQINDTDMLGKPISTFNLTDINGNKITSENTKGKVVVFNFWFTTCKPCISEIPELNRIHKKYKDNDSIVFASITFNEKPKVEKFLKKHAISYPLVTDERAIISAMGISAYPTNIVIGKDGKIADAIVGGFPKIGEHIDSAIKAALETN